MYFADKNNFCCDYVSIKIYKPNIRQVLYILGRVQSHIRKVALVIKTMNTTPEVMGEKYDFVWNEQIFFHIIESTLGRKTYLFIYWVLR